MTEIIPTNESHIYYDLKMSNVNTDVGDGNSKVFYTKDNASKILSRQDKYKMAITSFQLDLDIPLMVVPIEEGITQTQIGNTIFNIGIRQEGGGGGQFTGLKNIEFVTSNSNISLPKPPSLNNGVQDFSNEYYFIRSYQAIVDMVNNAIRHMIENNATWAPVFAPVATGAPVRYPVLEYRDQRFIWRYSGAWVTDDTDYNATAIRYYLDINKPLAHLLAGFKYTDGEIRVDNHTYLRVNLKDSVRSGAATLDPATGINGEDANSILSLKQEYDTRFRFNSISSIIITSDYIKVRPEFYPDTVNPNDTEARNNNFNTPIKNIISSFGLVDQSGAITWQEQQYYVPSVLKWMDLISSDALDIIDARVFYQLKRGGLLEANVPVDSQSTIKFEFRRKTALGD